MAPPMTLREAYERSHYSISGMRIQVKGPDGVFYETGVHESDSQDEDGLDLRVISNPEGVTPLRTTWSPDFHKFEVVDGEIEKKIKQTREYFKRMATGPHNPFRM